MKVLKPGEFVMDELNTIDGLAYELGNGQVPMRRKQGVFKPTKLSVMVALAYRSEPPPALVVQFDNWGNKTTFPARLGTV